MKSPETNTQTTSTPENTQLSFGEADDRRTAGAWCGYLARAAFHAGKFSEGGDVMAKFAKDFPDPSEDPPSGNVIQTGFYRQEDTRPLTPRQQMLTDGPPRHVQKN